MAFTVTPDGVPLANPPQLPNYTIIEALYAGSRTIVYRAVENATGRSVIIKLLKQEYPDFQDLLLFRNQYAITQDLTIPGVIAPHSSEFHENSYVLIMEDFGGISLQQYRQENILSLGEVLAIGVQLATILHDLHQARIIHKDLKPANILIHPQSKDVRLIDFSIASRLPKENQEIIPPNGLEGTLAYLAPEQTGRMNRGIDYRVDFYALGVTLFELLAGRLPFLATDPMELIHCHLAKQPPRLTSLSPQLPTILSDIVGKLMAKNAEDRYQSALGLKHDLEICLNQWQDLGEITQFPLGTQDLSDRFLVPERLYGRDREIQMLLDAFDRVANGASEFMLVAGCSGIGKTAVINEVHKPIVRQRGYFIKGKFDQFNRNIPLSAFVQSLRDLMAQLLSESDMQLDQWRKKILALVGQNGQVLVEVIPELVQIIGPQPVAPELSINAAQNRFKVLFHKFLELFSTTDHPLVLFLDDLQWADLASLQLIEILIQNNSHLLMLGAYRDNEVSHWHPLLLTIADLKKKNTIINTIPLTPLTLEDTNRLVADTLNCASDRTTELTALIDRKTNGNPFFTACFLKALHEDQHIWFNQDLRYWECDISQINALAITDNVVTFMASQLKKLPLATQMTLRLGACIGNQFDLETLAIVLGKTRSEAANALWPALEEGLILPTTQVYKFFQAETSDPIKAVNPIYRFLHDRIQQAAYSLIPEQDRAKIHYQIGRLFVIHLSSSTQEERVFELAGHLNTGIELIENPAERIELAQWNFLAGRKAMNSNAYEAALVYLNQAIALLPEKTWTEHYDLTLNLHHLHLEVTYLNTQFEDLEIWGEIILQQTTSLLDQIKVYEICMMALRSQGRFSEVVETGFKILKLLGIEFHVPPVAEDFPTAYARSRQAWQGRVPMTLLDLPNMQDPNMLAAMKILSQLSPSAYIAYPDLLPFLIFKQVELSIQYGNSPISIISYAEYGLFLCGVMGDVGTGYEFGQLALGLLEKFQLTALKSRTYLIVNSFIRHWKEPLQHSIPLLLEGYRIGLESGDWECVALNLLTCSHYQFFAGRELKCLADDLLIYRDVLTQVKHPALLNSYEAYLQTVLNLLEPTKIPYCLKGGFFDADQEIPRLKAEKDDIGLFHITLNQALLSYLFEQDEKAIQYTSLLKQYRDSIRGFFLMPLSIFYDALIQLRSYPNVSADRQSLILEQVAVYQEKLKIWAIDAPFNHQHRWQLIAAEQARVLNQITIAIEYYDLAIAGANVNGFIQDEALGNELAAKFYLNWGKPKIAAVYMQEAYYCYARWGSEAKIQDLADRYPQLLRSILQPTPPTLNLLSPFVTVASPSQAPSQNPHIKSDRKPTSSSSSRLNSALDLAAVLKASQAISGTIHLDELLHQLTQVILQNSGGDRCALILPDLSGQWCVEVIATSDSPTSDSPSSDSPSSDSPTHAEPLVNNPNVPVKLIQFVKNTREIVAINELKTDLPVIDQYFNQHQPESILALPILNQGNCLGILYLENQSTHDVFSSDQIEILNVLCTQAAISLENARIYQQSQDSLQALQQSQKFLRDIIDNLPSLIFWKDRHSTFLGCNANGAKALNLTSPEEIIGKNDDDFSFTPEEVAWYRQCDRHVMESGQAELHIIETQQRADGFQVWLDTSKIPLRDAAGNVIGILSMITDITARKAAELSLQESEQRFRDVTEAAGEYIWEIDENGCYTYVTEKSIQVKGYRPEELLGCSPLEFIHQEDIEVVQRILADASLRKTRFTLQHRNIWPNAQIGWEEVSGLPILNDRDEIIGFRGTGLSITERKQAEQQIQQQNHELQQAFIQLQQSQAQVIQSEKMSALGNLVAGVAHEINNPIGFLNGSVSNAQDYVKDLLDYIALYQDHHPDAATPVHEKAEAIDLEFLQADLPKLLNSMSGATDRIKNISTSLRTFSRADTEYKVTANLHEGIDSTILILKYRLKANEHRPEIQVIQNYGDLPEILCFPGQLNQVFMNILANAVDMFDEITIGQSYEEIRNNPQKITITTAYLESYLESCLESHIEIKVADNGKGMTESVQDKIFEHLFTTKEVGKGTGLGLAIARQIVTEKHGGEIKVRSKIGQGTEFTIILPITP